MSRLLQLIAPACLVATACSAPSHVQRVASPDFKLGSLLMEAEPRSAEAHPEVVSDRGAPSSSRLPVRDDHHWHDDDGHITLMLGQRMLDDSDWEPVDDQLAAGVEINGYFCDDHHFDDDHDGREGGHGYEFGFNYSQDDSNSGPGDVKAKLIDVYAGYRYTFRPECDEAHPYLSAGVAVIHSDIDSDDPVSDFSEDDISPGAYLGAGIGFDVSECARLGLAYRHFFLSDTNLGPIGDSDFDQIMLTLGFRF